MNFPSFTDQAIDLIDDTAQLRRLAKQYWSAMLAQHKQGEHLLNIDECGDCLNARDECNGDLACDDYRRWQQQYEDALRADVSSPAMAKAYEDALLGGDRR